jgi:2',3'-cyclic-nucleotide 2'-phosphodiesterase/3'-nucleotidase
VVEGSNAIRRLHDLVGSEKNYKSQSTTLRCRFGTDSIRNGFYCSTDEYNAIRDIYYWLCPNDIAAAVFPESNSRQYTLEDTVALIKPTFAESCYDEIMAIIAGHGFQVISECRFNLTSELLTELYPEMKPDNKFSKVREYMLSGPVVALQLRRDAALKGWRHLVGCIDMKKNQEERHDSIRFKYAVNSIENAVHGSYNSLMASKELSLFFPMLDVCDKGFSTSSSKLDKPKTAKRKKKKQTTTISNSKQSELHSYLSQDVNPVLNELVRNLAIQKPKDIMGYAIKDLIEKQKLDALKIGTKNRMSSSSTLPVLPDICHDHHSSSEKGVMDGLYMNKEKSDIDIVSLDAARSEVARLQETIRSISANLVENSESKNSTHINETLHVEANNALNSNRTIDVLSIGDLVGFGNSHSSILEGNAIACFSGALKSVQQRTGAMVLFTGGFLGCAHTIDSTHYSSMITLIDNLGVNYGILGTRDFEFGWDDVHNHLKFSHVTWIASNIVKPETGKPFKNCEEKVLVEWKGIQVGLIGLIDDWVSDVPSYSSSASNVKVLDPLEAAKRLCAELKDEGAEVILILSHCVSKEINEKLSALPDVQIVVSGHANGFESWKLNDSSLGVANGGLGGISSVSIAVSDSRLPVVAWPPGYIVVTTERQPYDIVDSIVSNLREESDSALATKLGTITSTELQCSKQRVRTSETPLGNLLTDMMRLQMKTDIAVLNAGAIHSDCSLGPGLITIDDISNSLPHDDYVASVTISGEQIMDMLNNSVSRAPSADGRFLQVSGISFEYKVETTDRERCFNVMVQDQVLDLKQFYTCAMTGWLLNMHDGYKCFKGVSVPLSNEFFPSIMQVVLNYFDKRMLSKADRYHRDLTEDDFDPVDTEIEGRIVLTDANVSAGYHESVTTLGRVRSSSSHDSLNSDDAVNQNGANEYQNDDDDVKEEEGVDYGAHDVLSSKF